YIVPAVHIDAEGAATWAATISEPQKREAVLIEVVNLWKRQDSTAANAWMLQTNAVSAETKAKFGYIK
nr:hypothetical protein [Verrucomicrobiota bacterium]